MTPFCDSSYSNVQRAVAKGFGAEPDILAVKDIFKSSDISC